MSISYPLTIPVSKFRSIVFTADNVTPFSTSPFTLKDQIYEYGGKRWRVDVQYIPLEIEDFKKVKGFLLALHGSVGYFYFGDTVSTTPAGIATGTPLVNGTATKGAVTLATKGWTTSTTNILKSGDDIQVDGYLYTNVTDVNSDGSGNATLDIWPCMHTAAADNTAITTSSAKSIFRLDTDSISWSIANDGKYDVSFSAIEAI